MVEFIIIDFSIPILTLLLFIMLALDVRTALMSFFVFAVCFSIMVQGFDFEKKKVIEESTTIQEEVINNQKDK